MTRSIVLALVLTACDPLESYNDTAAFVPREGRPCDSPGSVWCEVGGKAQLFCGSVVGHDTRWLMNFACDCDQATDLCEGQERT